MSKKNQPADDPKTPLEVRSYFVRGRNALLTRADFGSLYIDYYLHLMQHSLKYDSEHDQLLKDAIAALTLHLASRPQNETTAWTLNLQEPLVNVFVTGSSRSQNIVGRVFDTDVREADTNMLCSQVTSPDTETRQSTIDFKSSDVFTGSEVYYKRSEQRPARYFRISEEEFVMITAQPDCDLDWLKELNNDAVKGLDRTEELSLLERRYYLFECGCDITRILNLFRAYDSDALDGLFEEDEHLIIACPRCGARFKVTRELVDVYLKKKRGADEADE